MGANALLAGSRQEEHLSRGENDRLRMSWIIMSNRFAEPFLPFHLGYGEGREMVNSLMLLAFEANGVIALRIMKLMRGGRSARREAKLMVSEKIHAACEATASLMAGASGHEIVHRYRKRVRANAKRLSRLNSGRRRRRSRRK